MAMHGAMGDGNLSIIFSICAPFPDPNRLGPGPGGAQMSGVSGAGCLSAYGQLRIAAPKMTAAMMATATADFC